MSNKVYIRNLSNEVTTFPEYTVIDGRAKISTGTKKISVTGHARDLLTIQAGDYLFCDTGDETSEVRLITGINRIQRKIIIDEEFTVEPLDTDIKIVKVQSSGEVFIFNTGDDDVYIDGSILAPALEGIWVNQTGQPPIVIYGAGEFIVSNGTIKYNGVNGGQP